MKAAPFLLLSFFAVSPSGLAAQPAASGPVAPGPVAQGPVAAGPVGAGPAGTVALAQPSGPAETFAAANAAYEAGDYLQAITFYQQLLAARGETAPLLYDLGNAHLRNGQLGEAIAAYRRGLVLAPRHRDALANLAFARRSIKDAIEPPQPSELATTLFFWHYRLAPVEVQRALVLFNLLLWGILAARLFFRGSELLRWAAAACLLLVVAGAGSLAVHRWLPRRVAVVLPQEVEARAANQPTSAARFKLHAGSEVAVDERVGDWVRVVLPSGERGWIEREHLALLAL